MAASQETTEKYLAEAEERYADTEEEVTTDTSVTSLTVTEAGSYWLTGYDPINKKAGTAYPNCKTIDASDSTGEVVLVGNYNNNTLIAGEGKSSLWGGIAGNDTMQGGSSRDMFWYSEGDGNDWAIDFTAGTAETSDVLNLFSGTLSSVSRSGTLLSFAMADGKGLALRTVSSEADTAILYMTGGSETYQAKIGYSSQSNTLTYAEDVIYYQGGSKNDTLTLSGGTDAKVVWLDSSQGKGYSSIDIIDGSQSSGADQLAGGAASETIIGGRGEASLWGGAGSAADTLRAGTGENYLFYGFGEGNDVMLDTHRNDKVMLYDISLGQLTAANISGETVTLSTTAGQTLTVSGAAGAFILADKSVWVPNRQSKTWAQG